MQVSKDFESARALAPRRHRRVTETTAGKRTRPRQPGSATDATFPPTSQNGTPKEGAPVVGYASGFGLGRASREEVERQARLISRECRRRGLALLELVREHEPAHRKARVRPGLAYALGRISAGEAQGVVVADLFRFTHSATELGTILEWLARSQARLVATAHGLDTGYNDGRRAADLLIEVLRWERAQLSERTRRGLEAARRSGRSAVTGDPDLSERIAQMRAQGMTLQAIADRLNEEGVPTLRGGKKWRHSSLQVAAGYRRRQPNPLDTLLDQHSPLRGRIEEVNGRKPA